MSSSRHDDVGAFGADPTGQMLTMFARMALSPIVERPLRLLLTGNGPLPLETQPSDDFVTALNAPSVLSDPPSPFLFTVINRGVPVFRALLRENDGTSQLEYVSRRHADGARVSFRIFLDMTTPEPGTLPHPYASIFEHEWPSAAEAAAGATVSKNRTNLATPAELLAFRARNTLGIELLVSAAATDPHAGQLTPIILG